MQATRVFPRAQYVAGGAVYGAPSVPSYSPSQQFAFSRHSPDSHLPLSAALSQSLYDAYKENHSWEQVQPAPRPELGNEPRKVASIKAAEKPRTSSWRP